MSINHYETFKVERYVITGGPGTGKSTTINTLKELGYNTIDEAARSLIKQGIIPDKDPIGFQLQVVEKQLSLESQIPEWGWSSTDNHYLDRGLFDNVAYCKRYEINVPRTLQELVSQESKEKRYSKVFILDPLPFYANDAERPESETLARDIHQMVIEAYKKVGYEPVHVPVLAPKERVQYILNGGKQNGRML